MQGARTHKHRQPRYFNIKGRSIKTYMNTNSNEDQRVTCEGRSVHEGGTWASSEKGMRMMEERKLEVI